MRPVQIKYTDIRYGGQMIRVIRFPNATERSSAFVNAGEAGAEDPNSNLPETIQQELAELFKRDKLALYFDSIELIFSSPMLLPDQNMQVPSGFSRALTENEDDRWTWQETTLKAHYY